MATQNTPFNRLGPMTKKRSKRIVWISCLVVFGALILIVYRRPMLYEIPGDYRGWVVVRFERADCPALPARAIFRVVSVSRSGNACTSSRLRVTYTRFEYVYPDGRRKFLPGTGGGDDSTEPMAYLLTYRAANNTLIVFIGNKHELENSGPDPARAP